ncbi:MAG: ATP-NAD kinase [Promethearchaeota archaeon]|nr:MAG: ATP-NAD kinase [Candidatus Lokiarchaeota archaeon]
MTTKFILGLIINPIAGMGGSVGLKGTDGKEILQKAIQLGSEPTAADRARKFLNQLRSINEKIKFLTSPKFMGEYILEDYEFEFEIIRDPIFENYENIYETSAEHTKKVANILLNRDKVDLIVFVGGDGTARDIQDIIDLKIPCLGIPAGVKIYSSVFALTPQKTASLVIQFLWDEIPLKEREVVDINEEKYREGSLESKSYGYLLTPFFPEYSQFSKLSSPDSDLNNQDRIAERIIKNLKEDIIYLLGPGTTVKAITDKLNLNKSILGVDVLLNRKIIALDVNEQEILDIIKKNDKFKIIVSPIGRQGFIFGRGNLQISSEILKKISLKDIIIIATKYKLHNIPQQTLRIDTRDSKTDKRLRGLYKVITDYDEIKICEVE